MSTTEHNALTKASLKCAVWALQCQALVNTLTDSDPGATGFHRLAVADMANGAWDAFTNITKAHEPADLDKLWDDASAAAESAANLLMAYANTRTPVVASDTLH